MRNDYPHEADLKRIRDWPFGEWKSFMELVTDIWNHDYGQISQGNSRWTFVTGGWSGNEDILAAMQQNIGFWSQCWHSSYRGGQWEFEVK